MSLFDVDRRNSLKAVAAACLLGMGVPSRAAADQKLLRLVVGFPAGGDTDVMARAVANAMGGSGQQVIVENRPGAGSLLAANYVSHAKPDGNTLLVAPVVVPAFFPYIYSKLDFDPLEDLVPVAKLGDFSFALVVGANVPVKDAASFVAYVKANPGKISYGSLSAGTPSHFLGVLFNQAAGTDMTHVPYKGGAPVFTALQTGEIQAAFVQSGSAVELARAGRIRILGVTGNERSKRLPEVPTLSSAVKGLDAIDRGALWYGFFAPKGTDRTQADQLNQTIYTALKTATVVKILEEYDVREDFPTASAFNTQVHEDNKNWGKVIRSTGFTLD